MVIRFKRRVVADRVRDGVSGHHHAGSADLKRAGGAGKDWTGADEINDLSGGRQRVLVQKGAESLG